MKYLWLILIGGVVGNGIIYIVEQKKKAQDAKDFKAFNSELNNPKPSVFTTSDIMANAFTVTGQTQYGSIL